MAHNRHYILLEEENIDLAQNRVESELDNFGNENNWYSIIKVVDLDDLSEDNKKYINEELEYLNNEFSKNHINQIKQQIKETESKLNDKDRYLYYIISQLYSSLYELSYHSGEVITIDNLTDINDYYGYTYDEYGITNMINRSDDEVCHRFFVEIDMHS